MARATSTKNYDLIKILIAAGLITALVIFLLQWINSRKIKFAHYDAFGIDIPIAYDIHGIDVSRYQKTIKWEDVKEMNIDGINLDFAFIKATEGITLTDINFKKNWKAARHEKISRGAYHFFIPGQDAEKQAAYFISKVKLLPGDLPPVLDAEVLGNVPVNLFKTKIKTWLNIVEAHYKVKPIIYTNADFYKKNMGNEFDEYPLWVAHYYERKKPRIDRSWSFWQHNDRGNVNGINTPVDFNVFNGDSIAFAQLLVK